jgi:riboflavin synthase
MFSGIIENFGKVKEFKKKGDYLLRVSTNFKIKDIKKGSSISCNGVCLTVHTIKKNGKFVDIDFDISKETIKRTNLSYLKKGSLINLERSLRVGDEISGHFVFGHIDCTSKLLKINKINDSHEITLKIPKEIKKFIVNKCSVSLNGVSLTVNVVSNHTFSVNLVPYTWKNTTFFSIGEGEIINVEVDMLARYVTQHLK